MKKTTFSKYAIDNASILYLSLIRKDHTNTYRFTMTLTEDISPDILQNAVDRIYKRFPTVIAGFHPGFFHYFQVPAKTPPQVQPDPGCLVTMRTEEIRNCAYRVYFSDRQVSIEAFHALTDGFGAIASFTTLIAEYLRLKNGIHIPVTQTLVDIEQSPMLKELEDSYLDYESGSPLHLPSRYAYQLPGGNSIRDAVRTSVFSLPTYQLLDIARKYGVSITTLISSLMAESVMEIQQLHSNQQIRPVRIMVPIDLRRMFPSKTLRNFILYALPTMEPCDHKRPLSELLHSFSSQMHSQLDRRQLASIMAYNVKTQGAWYFQIIPLFMKCALMRLIYRFFGESNSSVTVTNLGNVTLPEEMQQFVQKIEVTLTPRVRSPYNCAIISYNGLLSINISRFPRHTELEDIFSRKLNALLCREDA
ncbi:MAG: hypothetical protein IJB59_01135 [Oscillospiraceae bacterium]|nr:hypothetical protein [Oscillospiraceae bacterium]